METVSHVPVVRVDEASPFVKQNLEPKVVFPAS